MSTAILELFNIFSETYGKDKAQIIIKDIEFLISEHRRELVTKSNLQETEHRLTNSIELVNTDLHNEIRGVELKLTKEIELVRRDIVDSKSSTIKWMIGFIISQTVLILTVITLLKLT